MKTTIEISDKLIRETKKYAAEKGLSLKSVIESALRNLFESKQRPVKFTLKKASFRGQGLQPGIEEGNWSEIRKRIYKGRGEWLR